MRLWLLDRNSSGYGELDKIIIAAETEEQARIQAVKLYRHSTGAVDFLFEEDSTAEFVGDARDGTDNGTLIIETRTPE